jgi:hypothetical protein
MLNYSSLCSCSKKFDLILTIEKNSIFSNSSHLEWRAELSDTVLKGTHQGTIPARLGLIWFSGFRGEDLNVKVYDIRTMTYERRRMPSDGKSSHGLWPGELKTFMYMCDWGIDFACVSMIFRLNFGTAKESVSVVLSCFSFSPKTYMVITRLCDKFWSANYATEILTSTISETHKTKKKKGKKKTQIKNMNS